MQTDSADVNSLIARFSLYGTSAVYALHDSSSMYAGQSSSVFEEILHIILRQTLTVNSVFAQPAVTFFLCHVVVELLAVRPSLLLVRRRGTLYLTIYVICRVAIVILDVS